MTAVHAFQRNFLEFVIIHRIHRNIPLSGYAHLVQCASLPVGTVSYCIPVSHLVGFRVTMKWFIVVVIASVFSRSQGQNFSKWCPNLFSDLSSCTTQYLNQLQSISNQFTDASKIMDVQALVASAYSTVCQPAALTALDNFYGCFYGKLWACIPSDWKNAFTDLNNAKAALKFMCDKKDDLDVPCLDDRKNKLKLVNCIVEGKSIPVKPTADVFLKFTCSLAPKFSPCVEAAYSQCKKRTVEVMKKVYEYQTPVGCDACMTEPPRIILIAFLVLAIVTKNIFYL